MSVAVSASDEEQRALASDALARIRAVGGLSARFATTPPTTRIAHLSESGGYRLKFPETHGGTIEAVIVNTGGGVAGGDRVSIAMAADPAASATISTATAERIYRSTGATTEIDVRLAAAQNATLAWLPQATILFSGARLRRRFTADIASDARLVVAETTVFGRISSGEVLRDGTLEEQWRIRRNGQLIFAEATRLDGDIAATLARPAVADGMRVVSLLLCAAPDIEDHCEAVREALEATTQQCRLHPRTQAQPYSHSQRHARGGGHLRHASTREGPQPWVPASAGMTSRGGEVGGNREGSGLEAGVSAWNGLLVVRLLGVRLDVVEFALSRALGALKLCAPPHVWPAPLP